jgi:dienelactone hydrolase
MKAGRSVAYSVTGAIALLLTLAVGQAQAAYGADGNLSDWVGQPTMLSGETRISSGELIYDDWLYDDYGADLDGGPNQPVFRGNLDPTRGDYRYPTNSSRYGYNAADLRELRVGADGRGLHLLVYLQTMKAADAAAVTVAIDDPRASSRVDEWPDGAGINTPGVDQFITFTGSGGTITDGRGRTQTIRQVAVNLDENAVEVDVPWRSLGHIRRRSVDLYVVSGLFDASTGRYAAVPSGSATSTTSGGGASGSTAVFDVGFDANEVSSRLVGSHWGDQNQSAALAGRDVSDFSHSVDLRSLEAGKTDDYQAAAGRFYNRIFRSGQSYGEGISLKNSPSSPGGSPDPQFLSPYQPYGLYIPSGYQSGTPAPLLLNGHSLDVNQNEYAVISPNLYVQLGDERSSFVITPLARGTDTWYINSGFKDVLEAWDDARAHYSIDDDRTSIGGYSMGGYMTYRLGLLMPDRFAAAAAYVGPPAYQLWVPPSDPQPTGPYQFIGNSNHIIENALNLPFEINNSGADELVPFEGPIKQAQTFQDLGRTHRFYFYPGADHFALILADQWAHTRDFLDAQPQRDPSPIEVTFKRYPAMDLPDIGLRFDGAYWVDRMDVRNHPSEQSFGQVDATTYGFGGNRTVPQDVSPSLYPGPPSGSVTGLDRVAGAAITQSNGFEATLQNLGEIAFDTARMGIDPNSQITASLTGDGTTTLLLLGQFPAVTATLDGQPVPVQPTSEGVEITANLAGQHQLVITP